MANVDHEGYKKIQCWVPSDTWDKIESLNYPSQTSAVTEAFKALLEKSQSIPTEAQEIPALKATIEGLQLLLQEKDERISDLKREAETLGIFAHYFKSLEYRRLEPQRAPESTHEDMVTDPGDPKDGTNEAQRAEYMEI